MSDLEKTIESLRKQYEEIRDEKKMYSNTATRIGNAFLSFLNMFAEDIMKAFLRKDMPDEVNALITFLKGVNFGVFEQNSSGAGVYKDADGNWHVEADFVYARRSLVANSVEVHDVHHVGGWQLQTAAACKCDFVVEFPDFYRCFFLKKDRDNNVISNDFVIKDQAYVNTFNLLQQADGTTGNHFYWRLVVGTDNVTPDIDTYKVGGVSFDAANYHYIDLAKANCADSSQIPLAGDKISQLGSRTDELRQGAIIQTVVGEDSPKISIYAGINDYELSTHEVKRDSPSGCFAYSDYFRIISASGTGITKPIVCNCGAWVPGTIAGNYDQYEHNGSTWLCVVGKGKTTTKEPLEGSADWAIQSKKGDKGDKGDEPVTVSISTDRGTTLLNGQGEVTLTAKVYRGDDDITDTIQQEKLSWTRTSANADSDVTWNAKHEGIGNVVTVSAAEVFAKAMFECSYQN